MSLIIDGHNLIGVLPGIHLGDPDDERKLVDRLRSYRAQAGGRGMIVFFDSGDMPSRTLFRDTEGFQVRFCPPGLSADDAIVAFLGASRQPGQYAVVTNDLRLGERARLAGASVVKASEFAARMGTRRRSRAAGGEESPPPEGRPRDPRDPAFADIFAAFLQAEKPSRAPRPGEPADVEGWLEWLYGEDPERAAQAALWLGASGGGPALEPLCDALTHGDARVRAAALLGLGALGDRAAQPAVLDRLASDPTAMVREAAAQALASIGTQPAIQQLETAARSDPKAKVRKAAVQALAELRARRK